MNTSLTGFDMSKVNTKLVIFELTQATIIQHGYKHDNVTSVPVNIILDMFAKCSDLLECVDVQQKVNITHAWGNKKATCRVVTSEICVGDQ